MLANKIKREQRVTQMVENAHEQHQVEAFAQSRNIVDGHLPKLDIGVVDLRHQLRLRQIAGIAVDGHDPGRSEEHTSELQSLLRISYAVFCLKKTNKWTDRKSSHLNSSN